MAQPGFGRMMEHFWHPVCAVEQVAGRAAGSGSDPIPVRLLGRPLVVARLPDGRLIALDDRCLHRSTPLSLGSVEAGGLRCGHHGWLWSGDGACREVPGQPVDALPRRARVASYGVQEAGGLVWTQLASVAEVERPRMPTGPQVRGATHDESVGALRRVDHLLDRAVGAWTQPVAARLLHPERRGGVLTVELTSAPLPLGLTGVVRSTVVVRLPTTIEVHVFAAGDRHRVFWAASVPVDHGVSRWCWTLAGDGVSPADGPMVQSMLAEFSTIETSKVPAELTLDRLGELSSRGDRVSTAYRRCLEDLTEASRRGPQLLAAALRTAVA